MKVQLVLEPYAETKNTVKVQTASLVVGDAEPLAFGVSKLFSGYLNKELVGKMGGDAKELVITVNIAVED